MDELSDPVSAPLPQGILPDQGFIELCIAAYIRNVHLRYPIVDSDDLNGILPSGDHANPIRFSRLCLLVAIGSLSLPAHQGPAFDVGPLIHTLQSQTWTLLSKLLASPYTDAVEILLLHTIFLLYSGKFGIAWVTCGFVIRVAQSLGLHHLSPVQLELSKEQAW